MKLLLFTIRGLGQIMLQRSAATGALFAVGLAVNSLTMALAAFLGSFAGTVMACIGRFPSNEIEDGLYGFNGALVAIAAMYFYSFSMVGFFVGAAGVIFAALLMRVMQKYSLMPFTFPFAATHLGSLFIGAKIVRHLIKCYDDRGCYG
jgi:urea transporter